MDAASGKRAGDILLADSTIFTTLFGGDESLERFWKNIAHVESEKSIDCGIRKWINRRILILVFYGPVPILLPFAQENENEFEIYGQVMTDGGYNFNTIDPDWFDMMRPSKLPSYKNRIWY